MLVAPSPVHHLHHTKLPVLEEDLRMGGEVDSLVKTPIEAVPAPLPCGSCSFILSSGPSGFGYYLSLLALEFFDTF